MDAAMTALIEREKKELAGDFCRGCGYCMPCPAGIEINNCARMSQMIRRSPSVAWLTPESQAKMFKIEDCKNCGAARKNVRTDWIHRRCYARILRIIKIYFPEKQQFREV